MARVVERVDARAGSDNGGATRTRSRGGTGSSAAGVGSEPNEQASDWVVGMFLNYLFNALSALSATQPP